MIVAASGKGGTGKTTFLALTLKRLLERGVENILMIDADPAANLSEVLGIRVERTLGSIVGEFREQIQQGELSPGISKRDLLEGKVYSALVEEPKYDLLAMGALERRGCFCYINSLLTEIVDKLAGNYAVVLMDMPAGLEHIARRTARDVDVMFIVTDASKMGLQSATRILDLAKKVDVEFRKVYLVLNRKDGMDGSFRRHADEFGLSYAGSVPNDTNVEEYNLSGKSLLEIPRDSPAYGAVTSIVDLTLFHMSGQSQ